MVPKLKVNLWLGMIQQPWVQFLEIQHHNQELIQWELLLLMILIKLSIMLQKALQMHIIELWIKPSKIAIPNSKALLTNSSKINMKELKSIRRTMNHLIGDFSILSLIHFKVPTKRNRKLETIQSINFFKNVN